MTGWYPEDPQGPVRPLWHYMLRPWRQWLFILGLWLLIGFGIWRQPAGPYWMVVNVLAWGYVVWVVAGIIGSRREHKEMMRRIERRHEARMAVLDRDLGMVRERMRNAPWN